MASGNHWTDVFMPKDGRLMIRHGDMEFTLADYPTRDSWQARADHLRKRILVSTGLWPMPERCALNPQITGQIEHEDYIIENVAFESLPGFFVTGNLYRPKGKEGPFPGVANPHGHWDVGRLVHEERGSIPARGATLARQGYIAFAYDMIGYNDSKLQIPHSFGGDPKGYLWGLSLLGLQLWNSIRVLDLLSSLPEVDSDRLACTGASGGGTQTFMLMAVDPRVKVAAPVNMISAHFQGGCLCENAPSLRLDCFNVEFGAMMAPRPLLMVSATGDWTKNTPQVEYPAVQRIYRLYGAADRVASVQVDAEHNYNQESREAVYAWFGKWLLGINDASQLKEQPITLDPPEAMLVFPDGKLPDNAVSGDELMQAWAGLAETQIESLAPKDSATLEAYRQVMGTAYQLALNATQPETCDLQVDVRQPQSNHSHPVEKVVLGRKHTGEEMPCVLVTPDTSQGAVLVVHPEGKAALTTEVGFDPLVTELMEHGLTVMLIDTFKTGELALLERDEQTRHFHTFNSSDTALRVQDILNAVAFLKTRSHTVHLVGVGQAGLWCLLARALTNDVNTTVIDADQFDAQSDDAWLAHLFVPHLRRAGDLLTAAALITSGKICIHNASATFPSEWFQQIYQVAGTPDALQIDQDACTPEDIVSFLIP